MKQVVLSLKEESEERLRRLAQEAYAGRKGSLSKTVEDALLAFEKLTKQQKALNRWMEIAKEGRKLGVGHFEREEAYR